MEKRYSRFVPGNVYHELQRMDVTGAARAHCGRIDLPREVVPEIPATGRLCRECQRVLDGITPKTRPVAVT